MKCNICGKFMKKNREGYLIECNWQYYTEYYCEGCNHYRYKEVFELDDKPLLNWHLSSYISLHRLLHSKLK